MPSQVYNLRKASTPSSRAREAGLLVQQQQQPPRIRLVGAWAPENRQPEPIPAPSPATRIRLVGAWAPENRQQAPAPEPRVTRIRLVGAWAPENRPSQPQPQPEPEPDQAAAHLPRAIQVYKGGRLHSLFDPELKRFLYHEEQGGWIEPDGSRPPFQLIGWCYSITDP